jgi:hypothetical protein
MDARWRIPLTPFRIGLDGIIGLIPGLGDIITAGISAWIVLEAYRLGLRPIALLRMIINVVLDFLLGTLPIAGDVADILFKANVRNLRIIDQELGLKRE